MATKNILIVPGDGIGQEVTAVGKKVLDKIAAKFGHQFSYDEALIGHVAIEATGNPLPDVSLEKMKKSDAVLFGAVGHPKYDNDPTAKVRPEQGLLKMRKELSYTIGTGAYAEERVIAADRLVKIPDGISDEQAAAMMLKGMTVEYLLRRTYKVQPGDTVLFHAAAGGVGLIFGEWARHLGATVIGTAGGPEKVALAKEHGFDHVIDYRSQDFVAEVREITGGRMCNVVYDSIGKDTFPASLDCLRPLGMFVSFGQASGVIPAFDMNLLARKGALFATRPTLFTYIAARSDLEASAAAMFAVLQSGAVKVVINQRSKLSDAAKVHTDLEARRTTGTSLLIP